MIYLSGANTKTQALEAAKSTTCALTHTTSKPDLERCVGDGTDQCIEEDIAEYETQGNQYRKKNRWSMCSMLWAHQIWWAIVILANLPGILFSLHHPATATKAEVQEIFALIAVSNLTATIIVRNELLLLVLYVSFNYAPVFKFHSHRMIHSIGGLHVGAGTATFIWNLVYMTKMYSGVPFRWRWQEWVLFSSVALLALCLFLMIITAIRPIRDRFHNIWEYTHRFVGWFSLCVLLLHVATNASMQTNSLAVFNTPLPYLIIVCFISVFYVWFSVRKVRVRTEAGNAIAILKFDGRPSLRDGTFIRISTDFLQWHAFSVAMTDWEGREFAVIMANAGDWTKSLIDAVNTGQGPAKVWVRGVNPPGFMTMHHAYSRVVTLATGAGIAPCLPQIQNKSSDISLIWIANDHRTTYGEQVWSVVTSLPEDQIMLHDTRTMGRPNAAQLITDAVKAHRAEAVFVVSNDRYTKVIIEVCWRMGLRCYGATRDS